MSHTTQFNTGLALIKLEQAIRRLQALKVR